MTAPRSHPRPSTSRHGWHIATLSGVPIRTTLFSVVVSGLTIAIWAHAFRGLLAEEATPLAGLAFAIVTYLILLASLLFHEFAHIFSARAYGNGCSGIVLTPFGMIAALDREPATPAEEIVVTGLGPLSSLALAVPFWFLQDLPGAAGLIAYVAFLMNAFIAMFNLIPCFPMDGGRLLRAGAWAWTGDILRGTTFAARAGWLGALLIVGYGVWMMLDGSPMGILPVALAFLMVTSTARHLAQMRRTAHSGTRNAGRIMRPFGSFEPGTDFRIDVAPGLEPSPGDAAIEIRRGPDGSMLDRIPASSMPRVRPEAGPAEMMEAFASAPTQEWPILLVRKEEGELVGYVTQGQLKALIG